jgi:crotonobetainyl-CoA:carnitine CoA-transferase CaiB-like acyl-CoA transferase
VAQRERVMAGISAAMAKLTRAEAVALLDAADVPNGPVLTMDETFADPHVRARGSVGEFTHPLLGAFPALRLPYRFDGLADPEIQRPPLLGEDTEAVLRDLLQYSQAQIETLRAEGAI